jgi:hypothetical protein
MRERVDVFGGKLTIQPRVGAGSCLTFRIPLGIPFNGAAYIDQSWLPYNRGDNKLTDVPIAPGRPVES